MLKRKQRKWFILSGLILTMFLLPMDARAVPSFARQTGQTCNVCHTMFPELTPFGRLFKLDAYALSKSANPYEFPPPITGMVQLTYTHVKKDLSHGSVEDTWARVSGSSENDFVYIPQEASVFYAGRIYGKTGAFVQGTYSGVDDDFFLDMTDVRYANSATIAEKNVIYGLTLNNSPTVQDVWNSTPVWSLPASFSEVAPMPAAAPLIFGGLDQQVGGLGLYGFWDDMVYGEFTLYRTTRNGITEFLGAGTHTDTVVDDVAPYWRVAVQRLWGDNSLEVGTYGIFADVFPEDESHGPTNTFTDIGLDAQYQYIHGNHIFSAETTWVHEDQDWDASFKLGEAAHRSDSLDTFRINLNYYYQSPWGKLGGIVAYFLTTGDRDALLYAPEKVDGSKNAKPDSSGFILQADYMPFGGERKAFVPKLSLQYIIYDEFNGAHSNYDGFGRDASDNNTLYALLWFLF